MMNCGSPATGHDQFPRFNPEFVPHDQQQEQNLMIDGEEVGLEQRLNGAGPFSLFICG
jgi:hypothetical protein